MRHLGSILLLAAALAACDLGPGPDSITSHQIMGLNDCLMCHGPGSTVAPDPLATNGSGTSGKHVAHVSSTGLSCDRCHYNYLNNPNHGNGAIDTAAGTGATPVIFDYLNSSSGTFTYASGPPASGNCSNIRCHVDTTGTPTTMDWYGPDVAFVLPNCDRCHSVPIGVRRQVLGASGDFSGNPSITSHHVSGADPLTDQCKQCHDQYHHMAGTVHLHQSSTGTRLTYDPTAPATLEPFCLGCHNVSGATFSFVAGGSPLSPFNDGSFMGTIPYVASATIASSWNGSSSHRTRGLTCAGTGSVNTGCHGSNGSINMHGSTVKGLLSNTMNFQIQLSSEAVYTANRLIDWNYNNYKLCFDCHASYPNVSAQVVLGYKGGGVYDILKAPSPSAYSTPSTLMQSLFRDRYVANAANYPPAWSGVNQPYNDGLMNDAFLPLHNYHLIGFEFASGLTTTGVNPLQWKYRGDPARIGRITCTSCHNVHGTAAPTVRSTHAELGLVRDYPFIFGFSPFPGESYTSFDPLINETIMSTYPMNCAIKCHRGSSSFAPSSYWHTPNGD